MHLGDYRRAQTALSSGSMTCFHKRNVRNVATQGVGHSLPQLSMDKQQLTSARPVARTLYGVWQSYSVGRSYRSQNPSRPLSPLSMKRYVSVARIAATPVLSTRLSEHTNECTPSLKVSAQDANCVSLPARSTASA
jgi:hypothetical protein